MVANSLNGLAQVLRFESRDIEVEPLYRRALAIWESSVGPRHPDYARCLGNLADCYRERGKQKKAVALYKRSIKILTGALGPDHPEVSMERDGLNLLLKGPRIRQIQSLQ
ncbi:MAG: tetratricopeptide repeat protein [Acidobacteriota bacterium]|nr:tetratricopeptide repeat protein [Acidobacteriota bacterium]